MDDTVIVTGEPAPPKEPVDRRRRYWFISRVTAFTLVVIALLAFMSGFGWITATPVVVSVADGLMSLAVAVILTYIGGSVIDYNGGLGNMFAKSKYIVPRDEEGKG